MDLDIDIDVDIEIEGDEEVEIEGCGDYLCVPEDDEDRCTCPRDCAVCGDGQCTSGEAGLETCPADCHGPGAWVLICAGTFTMGAPQGEVRRGPDEVQHEVTLTRDFEVMSTEVTQADFEILMGYNPSHFTSCTSCPVERVSWHEAAAYCNVLSDREGSEHCYDCSGNGASVLCEHVGSPYECSGYRLPTEAEWEYAARAGTTTASYGGDFELDHYQCFSPMPALENIAWYACTSDGRSHEVGALEPNPWGLFDVLGNVWEWCHDRYGSYPYGPVTDPVAFEGSDHVIRGGSWYFWSQCARAAYRGHEQSDHRGWDLGFRVVRSRP